MKFQFNPHIEEFPLLQNIKKDRLPLVLMEIFQKGYQEYFNISHQEELKVDKNMNQLMVKQKNDIVRNMDNQTDSVKLEINKILYNLKNSNIDKIDDKIDKFNGLMEQLFGITQNSSKKGNMSEEGIYQLIKNKFPDLCYKKTRSTPHSGDGELVFPCGLKSLVEIKNYTNIVDIKELEKFKYDMKHTGLKYGIFISLQNNITGKKRLSYEQFKHNGEIYHAVYVPGVLEETSKVESAILILERLYELNTDNQAKMELEWIQENIVKYFKEVDEVCKRTSQLRDRFGKMENSIKDQMSNYYVFMREYEQDLKMKIDYIWTKIMADFQSPEILQLTDDMDSVLKPMKRKALYQSTSRFFDIINKSGGKITVDAKDSKLWQISKKNKVLGTVKMRKDKLDVSFVDPNVTLNVQKNNKLNENCFKLVQLLMDGKY